MAAQVMIEFVPDTSKVKGALDQIEAGGGDTTAFKEGNVELDKRNKLLQQNLAAQKSISDANKQQLATVEKLSKATSAAAGSVVKISGSEFAKMMQEQGKSADQLINSLAGVTQETAKQEKATKSLRAEKRELQQQIAQLIASGQQESKTFRDLVARAGELDDAVSDANDAIRRTGSDTRGLDNALLAARGVAAAFQVGTSVAALFGEENEDVQKALLKVNAAMGILNGLQEIQNLLKSEYVKALFASTTAQSANVAALEAETVAAGEATVATTALNTSILATPAAIAAAVAALAAIVAGMVLYINHAEEAADAALKFNSAANPKALESEFKAFDDAFALRAAEMRKAGAEQSEIDKAELANMRLKGQRMVEEINAVRQLLATNQTESNERNAAIQREATLVEMLDDLNRKGKIKGIELEIQIREERKKSAEEAKRQSEEAEQRAERARQKALANLKTINLSGPTESLQQFLASVKAASDDAIAGAKLALLYTQQGSQLELEARIDVIEKTRDAALQDATLTANQRRLIEAQADKDISDLRIQHEKDTNASKLEIQKAAIQQSLQLAQEAGNIIFENEKARIQNTLQYQLDALNKQKDEALSTDNLTKAQQKEIQKRYDRETAKLKTEAARKQRQADLNAAYVNTLLAITNALATTKPFVPTALIAAASAFTTGMLQVARISTAPLPQYAKGGKDVPAGYAIVGEQGPEIVKLNGGEDIFTTSKSKQMMRDWSIPDHSIEINANSSGGIDYEKLAEAITRKMPRQPNVSLNADEHGFSIYLEAENHRKTIRNQRYSTR